MLVQEEDWVPAVEAGGTRRDGAWLVELTDLLDHRWGDGVRVIARRERPHPCAQLTLFDAAEGFRHQVSITDRPGSDLATLELRHRHGVHVENRIRAAKDSELRNLPCEDFVRNEAWLQLVLCAQDLHAWAQALRFDGEVAVAEPKKRVTVCGTPPPSSPAPAARHRPFPGVVAMDDRHRHRLPTPRRRPAGLNAKRPQRRHDPSARSDTGHAHRTRRPTPTTSPAPTATTPSRSPDSSGTTVQAPHRRLTERSALGVAEHNARRQHTSMT